ncbi:polysialyltransferase family glycosyltransferase [[Clostridium] aminophilum]|uniref:CDP-Glycerol:Poly(Glycerophosphate) glycerophosphotransferase n=1 Tax=[Clostridium] aminophilum TaxID=1526 RepID=A0A1I6K636_9FIRM|nr:polysialyltransferase family glycosyltransferase [[Clostridium] aminophilum]SFR86538.1 hypothetical protein SAMN02910262_02275 [[Clostridium] aminophilum]
MVHFVFVALTTYQLMVSDIYARQICEKYIGKVTIVSVGLNERPADHVSYELIEIPYLNGDKYHRVIQRLVYGGRLFRFSKLSGVIRKEDKTCLFIFNDNEPITNKLLRIVKSTNSNLTVLLDEGIGSYADTREIALTTKQKIRWLFTSGLGSPMQYKAIGDNPLIDVAFVSNKELYASLRKATKQKVFPQDKRALYVKSDRFLADYYSVKKQELKCDVVYLGQPFYENSEVSKTEADYICKVFEMVPSNLRIVIKPHPRDQEGKYSFLEERYKNTTVIDNELAKLPLECLSNIIGAKIMIGHNSSALINIANSFSGIVCCLTYRLPCAENMHKVWMNTYSYSSYDDSMYSSVNNNIFIPDNDNDFIAIFNSRISSNDIDDQCDNNDFNILLTYCLETMGEGEE